MRTFAHVKSEREISAAFETIRRLFAPYRDEFLRNLSVVWDERKDEKMDKMLCWNSRIGLLQHDNAIVSASRKRNTDGSIRSVAENMAACESLRSELETLGMNYFPVRGYFREREEDGAEIENSFIVYNSGAMEYFDFFRLIFRLSEKFRQESFLYLNRGCPKIAFLVNTDPDVSSVEENIGISGRLYVDIEREGYYTEFGNYRISFANLKDRQG